MGSIPIASQNFMVSQGSDDEWKPGMSMEELEKLAIARTLEYFSGNKVQAARALGISERSLRTRVNRYNLLAFMKRSGRPRKSA